MDQVKLMALAMVLQSLLSCSAISKKSYRLSSGQQIDIVVNNYPFRGKTNYSIGKDSILISQSVGNDSLANDVGGVSIRKGLYAPFEGIMTDFAEDQYVLPCIEDGVNFDLMFTSNDTLLHTVRISNTYHEGFGEIVKFLNRNVDDNFEISYDEDYLQSLECE